MSVNSVSSSSSSSSIYGSRSSNIVSGLVSGLDTESMIEGMVSGIKSKIDTQKQNQQILLWQQEAYRSISDQLVQISNKYTSYTSSTNLMSSAFFQPSIITSLGENAGKISASGSTTSNIQISSVTKMAQTETISFTGLDGVQNGESLTNTKSVDLTGQATVSNLAGKQLSFEYGNKSFSITFDSDRVYEDLDDVVDEINKQLGNASISLSDGSSITMDSKIKAQVVEAMDSAGQPTGEKTIAFTFKDGASETNTLELRSSSSQSVLDALNLQAGDKLSGSGVMASHSPIKTEDLSSKVDVKDILAGATMNVTYNGTTATIKMPEAGKEYDKIFGDGVQDAGVQMQQYLQAQFDQAFGYNRITVGGGSGNTFQPTFSVKGKDTLSIDSGTLNVIGKSGIFGIERGASNRVNTSKTLGELYGLDEASIEFTDLNAVQNENGSGYKQDENGNKLYALEINGVKIGEYSVDTTLETIMNEINNNEKAGVKVSYSTTSNQFVFTSKHGGAGGQIEIGNDGANLAAKLFGTVSYETGSAVVSDPNATVIHGQDAEMTAIINGVATQLTSGTNTFNIDGFTVTANGTFSEGESVTFDAKVDADKIVDAVKSFVEDYNKVLAEISEQYTTQPDHKKDYKPLTDDQKADMTEKQIEEYEAKAKEGLLFGDSDLGSLSNALRFVFSDSDLDAIGVSVSTSYSDKGKITLDETKLRSALASDPDAVASAFSDPLEKKLVTNDDGTTSWQDDSSSGGAMARLKVQLDKYAATTGATKGILIEKAGSQYSPMALLQNTLQDKIDSYDDVIDKLTEQLNDKIDFYTSKFSKLEALIAQMNSQSSYLSSMGGSSY
nr:flagellar filament capping protein FliD [uncultured Agathobaculum sp.]